MLAFPPRPALLGFLPNIASCLILEPSTFSILAHPTAVGSRTILVWFQACARVVVFARRDRYPVFHHLRKFPALEIQKLGRSTVPSKNWANNFWDGADKFLIEGATR
jgi:hypothetical protein